MSRVTVTVRPPAATNGHAAHWNTHTRESVCSNGLYVQHIMRIIISVVDTTAAQGLAEKLGMMQLFCKQVALEMPQCPCGRVLTAGTSACMRTLRGYHHSIIMHHPATSSCRLRYHAWPWRLMVALIQSSCNHDSHMCERLRTPTSVGRATRKSIRNDALWLPPKQATLREEDFVFFDQ